MKRTLILMASLIIIFTGCTPHQIGNYTAEFSYDPLQYMTFLKKEIQSVENQINTAMSHTVMVGRGDLSAKEAGDAAQSSLSIIKASCSSIDVMRPPDTYVDTRESIENHLENRKGHE